MQKKMGHVMRYVMPLVSVASLLTGCGKQAAPPAPPPPEVAVVTVKAERVVLSRELPGRASAYQIAEIRPQISGVIEERLFEEGAEVEAGAILYRIDPKLYEAAVANAAAALAQAQAAVEPLRLREARTRTLLAERAISQQDYDDVSAALKQAEAMVQTAEAGLKTAQINLDYTEIRSPIAGHSGRSHVTVGALVTAYQPLPLTSVRQLDPIYVDAPQATADLLRLQHRLAEGRLKANGEGQAAARLLLEDGSTYPLEGRIAFQEVAVDPTTGTSVLRMVFPNPDGVLLPGMFVRAIVEESVAEAGMLLMQQAVSRDARGEPFVLIVDGENIVQQRMVTIDRPIGNRWLIATGLEPGERVIIEGLQRARPGAPVRVAAAEDKAPDA